MRYSPRVRSRTLVRKRPWRTLIRFLLTRRQRRPTLRSNRTSTRPVVGFGDTVPEIATLRPAWRCFDDSCMRSSGRTRIEMGDEASGGRVASPRKAARSEPEWESGTDADHVPSAAHTAPAMAANVAPGTANWISRGAPAGDEPSGKPSEP